GRASRKETRAIMLDALHKRGSAEPERISKSYAFQLSGGMCQRIMIAIATILRPRIILADEPTSALDVTVQAAILREINMLKEQLDASIVLITHDLGILARMADEVST